MNKNKGRFLKNKFLQTIVVVIALSGLAVLAWLVFVPKNYAQQVVAPIEKAFTDAGAVSVRNSGDNGRSIDNRTPYYDAVFTFSKARSETIETVKQIASENGYSLKQGSPQDRGWLGAVADVYIENWYFDTSNKVSPYSDLESGNIELAFEFGDEDNPDPENSTTVRLSVKLPSFKK